MTVKRTSQVVAEALSQSDPAARISQLIVETASASALAAKISQLVVEMVSENVPDDPGGGGQTAQMLIIGM